MTLRADDLGARVVVRHRLPDGRATDVIGRLVHLDAASVTVRPAGGGDVHVLADDVVASRAVGEPRDQGLRRSRPVSSLDGDGTRDHDDGTDHDGEGVLATPVEVAAARTGLGWSGRRVEPLGGWLLRSGPAAMMRGRSALAAGDPGVPLCGALDAVVDHYRGLGLTPAVQVSSALPAPATDRVPRRAADDGSTALEELLAASGWAPRPWTVLALRQASRPAPAPALAPVPVRVAPSPDGAWFAASDHHGAPMTSGDLPPERDGVALAYATARVPGEEAQDVVVGEVVGVARGALAERWLGVTCVSVDPAHRRRGVAGALVTALETELGHGARALYAQVVETDGGARDLWRALGFTDHSRYRFWTLPDAA